ncbi:MAG TPA: cytochrome c [Verrucomicrobiae bacterium]|nr:cytochrome c [Verrucomicrobiae bacterium]
MSVTAQKYLVGFLGLILTGSVIATGYLDTQRRKKENAQQTSASAAAPAKPLSPELERGLKVYNEFSCQACHGPQGKGGVHNYNAQTAQEVPALIHVADGYKKDELIAKIQNGVPIEPKLDPNGPTPPLHMPGFKDLINQQQMEDLVAYLISLKPKGEDLGF